MQKMTMALVIVLNFGVMIPCVGAGQGPKVSIAMWCSRNKISQGDPLLVGVRIRNNSASPVRFDEFNTRISGGVHFEIRSGTHWRFETRLVSSDVLENPELVRPKIIIPPGGYRTESALLFRSRDPRRPVFDKPGEYRIRATYYSDNLFLQSRFQIVKVAPSEFSKEVFKWMPKYAGGFEMLTSYSKRPVSEPIAYWAKNAPRESMIWWVSEACRLKAAVRDTETSKVDSTLSAFERHLERRHSLERDYVVYGVASHLIRDRKDDRWPRKMYAKMRFRDSNLAIKLKRHIDNPID